MIVADANLIAYFVWRSEYSADADRVWERDPVWVAPPLWMSEVRSALGRAVRRGDYTVDEAVAVMDRAAVAVEPCDNAVPSRAILDLSEQSGCTTYDCEYVALAIALGVPLVTADREVLRAFPNIAVAPKSFAGDP